VKPDTNSFNLEIERRKRAERSNYNSIPDDKISGFIAQLVNTSESGDSIPREPKYITPELNPANNPAHSDEYFATVESEWNMINGLDVKR